MIKNIHWSKLSSPHPPRGSFYHFRMKRDTYGALRNLFSLSQQVNECVSIQIESQGVAKIKEYRLIGNKTVQFQQSEQQLNVLAFDEPSLSATGIIYGEGCNLRSCNDEDYGNDIS